VATGFRIEDATVAKLQAAMQASHLTAELLVAFYLERIRAIDQSGPTLRSVQEVNPDAIAIARALDDERRATGARGPLHGIPVLLKDNLATADRMETTAGALALVGARPRRDSFVAQRLREAGAVILGKAALSEWANFKSNPSSSGWSARNGQARNPHVLDRTPGGSSSGSGIAVAANLVTVSVGTETDGSIISPAAANGVVGIKPTVGLTSRAGVIPISATQDTVGPFGRSVADAAALLGAMTSVDPRDPATEASAGHAHADYTRFLDRDALRGARIGVPRHGYFGYSARADAAAEAAMAVLRSLGAEIVDPVAIPHFDREALTAPERVVFCYEFKAGVNAYLADVAPGAAVKSLEDIIAFNTRHAAESLPFFGQQLLERAQATGTLTDPAYLDALATCRRLGRDAFDAAFDEHRLDAMVAPTAMPPWPIDLVNGDPGRGSSAKSAALAGYPLISVPAGEVRGLPLAITFMGRAWSEPRLIAFAYAYEQATQARRAPRFLPTVT
jgi:amidase